MKPAGYSLLAFVVPGLFAAEPAAPLAPAHTSARLTREIRAGLPAFVPPTPPPDPVAAETPPAPDDPDLLKLPKFVIKEKRPANNDPDLWLTRKSVQQKARVAYKTSLTDLEWALNSWFIPLFGSPPSARARQYYEGRKVAEEIGRLKTVIDAIGTTDPKTAAKLREAMDPRKLPKEN